MVFYAILTKTENLIFRDSDFKYERSMHPYKITGPLCSQNAIN